MKIYNVALNMVLLLASPNLIQGKPVIADTIEPSFPLPQIDEVPSNRYIVKFKVGASAFAERMKNAPGKNKKTPPADDILLTHGRFLPKQNAEIMYLNGSEDLKAWEERDDVDYVELDTKVYLQAEQTPYGINKVHALDVPDADVSNRKVCIIDTGYDITHPDLTSDANVVTGYTGSFSAGAWDYDGHGHGTHVAGTIAAIGGNNQGVVGVNRNGQVKLHIVKVFDNSGTWAWSSSLIAAVEACVDRGSNIVSMSLGGGGYQQSAYDAYKRIFTEDDVLLVAAAGNGGNTAYSYPASYDYVMSVAATDSNNNVAGFSQKNDQVDIAAPGVGVLSTLPSHVSSSGYASWSGTSMATPHVSGVAALVWSLDTSKSAAEIRGILEESAEDLGNPGHDNSYGHGLVRADRARDLMEGFTLAPTSSPTPAPPCDDDPEGWYDRDGPTYDCAWYAQGSNCETYGDNYENFGKTANEACCVCGGGITTEPNAPSTSPTQEPSFAPSMEPSSRPSLTPSSDPSGAISDSPSSPPSVSPSTSSATPTLVAETSVPSTSPTQESSFAPSMKPSSRPSLAPSSDPSGAISGSPSVSPSAASATPTLVAETSVPSTSPTQEPSFAPSMKPSSRPSLTPSSDPSGAISGSPSVSPSAASASPTLVAETSVPSTSPTQESSFAPSMKPSSRPSLTPSSDPSGAISDSPSSSPSVSPSAASATPTLVPDSSSVPSTSPTAASECPTGELLLKIKVVTDSNGSDDNKFKVQMSKNRRRLKNSGGKFKAIWRESGFEDNAIENFQKCLPRNECYMFIMKDKGKDGMCCENGQGGFIVTWADTVVQDTLSTLSFTDGKKMTSPMFGDGC